MLSEWNLLALLLVSGGIGAAVGWFPHPLFAIVLIVGGVWLLYDGYSRWQQLRLVEDTTTEPVRAVAAGQTEVYGTCEPLENPVDRPFSDGECVLAYWEVEELRDDEWKTIASGMRHVPFVIDDGTGSIRVEPTVDATTRISDRNRHKIRTGGTRFSSGEPEKVIEFLAGIDGVGVPDTGLLFRTQRRYTEAVLPPGEEAYVFGGAAVQNNAEGSNPERLVLSHHETSGEFIISDRPQEEFVEFDRTLARNEIGMGATLIFAFLAVAAVRLADRSVGFIALILVFVIFFYGLWFEDWW